MDKKEWTSARDGSKGITYKLEAEDIVIPQFDKPYKSEKGKYPSYFLGVKYKDEELTVNLTPTQFKMIEEIGDVKDIKLECYSYESSHRKGCVGIQRLNVEDIPTLALNVELSEEDKQYIPQVKEWIKAEASDEQIIKSLKEQTNLTEGKIKKIIEDSK